MAEEKRRRELARLYGGSEYRAHMREPNMSGVKRQAEVSSGAHRQKTEESLVFGGFGIVLLAGGALMVLVLGSGPAAVGIGVVLIVVGIFLLLYRGLGLLESWLKRTDHD